MLVDFVSHEIRTPISCIQNGAASTKEFLVELRQNLDLFKKQQLDDLDEAIDTQEGLIDCALSQQAVANDLLSLSAISLNRYEISSTAVDIVQCCQKLLQGW